MPGLADPKEPPFPNRESKPVQASLHSTRHCPRNSLQGQDGEPNYLSLHDKEGVSHTSGTYIGAFKLLKAVAETYLFRSIEATHDCAALAVSI